MIEFIAPRERNFSSAGWDSLNYGHLHVIKNIIVKITCYKQVDELARTLLSCKPG